MKKTIIFLVMAATLITGTILSGCNSTPLTPEEEAAQVKVDEAKDELKDAQKEATAEEWELFKTESEEKIRINELSIAEFKDQMSMSNRKLDAVYLEKIDTLEKQNKSMKDRIFNYEKRKGNWESFKLEFNHDMEELGKALKDITVDNKK